MSESHTLPFLREALVFLTLSGILIPLLQRFRVNQIVGFLAVGVLLGANGLALWIDTFPWLAHITFHETEGVAQLAELGVIFLMFMIGLELSAERLWALRKWVFGAGTAQVMLSAACIGVLAWAFGNRWPNALVLGLVLALSSTAVVVQLLTQRQALGTPLGQATFSVLMLQDLAVVPVLILIDLLGPRGAGDDVGTAVGLTVLKSVLVVGLIVVFGRRLIQPVFRAFAQQRQPEVFMALTLLISMSMAGLTAAAGLSMALGAFLAGLLLAETEFRHEVEITIEPFKGLLMGLFFMSVGMGIDVRAILHDPVWLPLSVVGLIALKAAIVAVLFRAGGLSWGRSIEGGFLLGQGGEFAFIVVGVAAASGLMDRQTVQFILLVVGLSLFVTPMLARWGAMAGEALDARLRGPRDTTVVDETDVSGGHVVITGFGRVGRLAADVLSRQGVPWIAVEHDAARVAQWRSEGRPVFYGNASRPEMLQKLHVDRAAVVMVTMDQPAAALHAVQALRSACPHVPVVARSRDEDHARELLEAGATVVVPEAVEAGLQLTASALQALGVPDAAVAHTIELERGARKAL
ncbi:cation:proton antiporter [uncultured Aquabacterium sp.]|uniref:cation:proton antiporter domain-containing protein n=1 Tax=uncultured Aquabacterium sp. TaxID=158753 RepID=UPI00261A87E9|nr:cation:proton antiporter [uncultured Aquabacterium sp.]